VEGEKAEAEKGTVGQNNQLVLTSRGDVVMPVRGGKWEKDSENGEVYRRASGVVGA